MQRKVHATADFTRRSDDAVEQAADRFAGFAGRGIVRAHSLRQLGQPQTVNVRDSRMQRHDGFGVALGQFSRVAITFGRARAHASMQFGIGAASIGDRVDQPVKLRLRACMATLERGAAGKPLAATLGHRLVILAHELGDYVRCKHLFAQRTEDAAF